MNTVGGTSDITGTILMNLLSNKKKSSVSALEGELPLAKSPDQKQGGNIQAQSAAGSKKKDKTVQPIASLLTHNVHGNSAVNSYKRISESSGSLRTTSAISLKA